ncbi:MAG: AbrB/MazE/SpoVT family DNA-binding domain-containing protein [Acidobacteria bacterium]|nr:AbrB/MazE/SpoVT family DNA-binding domain-containing protein [Acidobacteriota bacterium]
METAYVTSKGQLVIPAALRKRYGIKPGTKVRFIERGGEIIIQPVTKEFIRNLRGILRGGKSATAELLKERGKDREREERKFEKIRSR